MSIVRMKKVQLFAHKEIKQQLLSFLQQQGVIQLHPLDHSQNRKVRSSVGSLERTG